VLIVDDEPGFCRLARDRLEAEGLLVVGEADDVDTALDAVRTLRPDVVVLDVRLPDGSGVDLTTVVTRSSEPPAMVLTSTADHAQAALECGATGFIAKNRLIGFELRAIIEAT